MNKAYYDTALWQGCDINELRTEAAQSIGRLVHAIMLRVEAKRIRRSLADSTDRALHAYLRAECPETCADRARALAIRDAAITAALYR